MDRLTNRDEFGNADIISVDSEDLQVSLGFDEFNMVTDALNRLAAYEDTGLTPEEVSRLSGELERVTADYERLCIAREAELGVCQVHCEYLAEAVADILHDCKTCAHYRTEVPIGCTTQGCTGWPNPVHWQWRGLGKGDGDAD